MRALLLGVCAALLAACAQTAPAPAPQPRPWVSSTEPWTAIEEGGAVLTTDNYRLFLTARNPVLLRRAPGFLERALIHYTTAIVPLPKPREPMETFILKNRPQWSRLTISMLGADAKNYLSIERGGFANDGRGLLWDIGVQDTLAIASHEGWHQYTQSAFAFRLPPSLEEGLACYMEGFRWSAANPHIPEFLPWANVERFENLRDIVGDGRLTPLIDLLTTSPGQLLRRSNQSAVDWYAQVWALTHMLASRPEYRPQLELLLRDCYTGAVRDKLAGVRTGPNAVLVLFELYFGPIDAAARTYDAYVRTIVRPGAKQLIVEGRSPV